MRRSTDLEVLVAETKLSSFCPVPLVNWVWATAEASRVVPVHDRRPGAGDAAWTLPLVPSLGNVIILGRVSGHPPFRSLQHSIIRLRLNVQPRSGVCEFQIFNAQAKIRHEAR